MIVHNLVAAPNVQSLYARISQEEGCAFLDSACCDFELGRFSYLLCRPSKRIAFRNGLMEVTTSAGTRELSGDPFDLLRQEVSTESGEAKAPFPFAGGAVGYLTYEMGTYADSVRLHAERESVPYEMRFLCYDGGICIDHERERAYAFAHPRAEDPERLVESLRQLAAESEMGIPFPKCSVGELVADGAEHDYLQAVDRIRRYIRDGDVYQVNLSQRFEAKCEGSPASIYDRLRSISPAPYACYMDFGEEQILSSSPEQLLKYQNREAVTRPIKGTRARSVDRAVDESNRNDLASSEKDKAELLMIVDLERNDLGKVCEPGSIEVENLFRMEAYATVFHQTASVRGRVAEDKDGIDCLKAIYPGGSITGAPKLRAMEIIDSLEPSARGVYTGAIGYIGYDGAMEFNVAIRTLHCHNERISFHVGAGIVWDSDPKNEYEETLDKAVAMIKAIEEA